MSTETTRAGKRTARPDPWRRSRPLVLSRILTCWLALSMICLFGTSLAQEETTDGEATETVEEAPKLFIDTVDVNIVNVDVFVTDKDGNRVTGLTKDDFEMFEDGRPVQITNFYAVEDGLPNELPEVEAESEAPPAIRSREEALDALDTRLKAMPVPEDQRLHLIVYVDNLFIRQFNRNKVMRQVRQFLHTQLTSNDRVMLVTFDRSTHIRHPFTSDMNAISRELFEIEELTGWATQADTDRKNFMRRIDTAETELEAEGHATFYAESLYHDMTSSVNALKELVGSLAGVPGRKAILYVSDGIPMTPGLDMFFLFDQRFTGRVAGMLRANRFNGRRMFRELTARANANRVTFYTIEGAGLKAHSSLSAEYGGSIDLDSGLSGGSRIEADYMRLADFQEPLQNMAADTGGLAALGTNNIAGALGNMAQDFQNYYSLGYAPANSGDGRFHEIDVRIKRKGLKARYRQGYRDKSSEARVSEGTLAALLYGVEANPIDITLGFDQQRLQEKGHYIVPLQVRVPLGKLALIPQQGIYQGRFRVSVAVIDDEGRLSAVEQNTVPIVVPEAEIEIARKQYFVYTADLLMRQGGQQVAVGLRDELAGDTSFVRQRVRVGS